MKEAVKSLRILLAVLLTAALLLATTATAAAAKTKTIAAGVCGAEGNGANLTWKLDNKGTLTVSGSGPMADFVLLSDGTPTLYSSAPWRLEHRYDVKNVVIKSGVTSIGDYAFDSIFSLERISLHDTLQRIGAYAIWGCDQLKALRIPNSVTSIGEDMCGYCRGIETLKISESLTTISAGAFYFCSSLKSVVIPEKVTVLGRSSFYYCTSLESVKLPSHLTEIGGYSFCMCNLNDIQLPDTLTKVGYNAIHAKNPKELVLPEGLLEIDAEAFHFPELEHMVLPSGLTKISAYMLSGCPKVTDLIIPDGVTAFEYRAFGGCEKLTELIIPDGVMSLGEQSMCNIGIKTVTIPRNVTAMGRCVLQGCKALEHAKITNNTTIVPEGTFESCGALKSVVLPASLKTVGVYAFLRCEQLSDVYFLGTEDQWNQLEIEERNEPLLQATVHYHTADHSVTETPEVPSTCAVKGHTAGVYCNDCGVYLSGNDTSPLLRHAWSDWQMTKEPTTNAAGTVERTCADCGATQQETVDPMPKPENNGGEQSETFFEKIAQWFRDLFANFASLFRF